MSGLGPHGSSLLARLERMTEPPMESVWYLMEQIDRTQERLSARIRYAAKHKAKKKPLAPVEETDKRGNDGFKAVRLWKWIGEDIESKNLRKHLEYTSVEIRKAGFKLPPLAKKPKKRAQPKRGIDEQS